VKARGARRPSVEPEVNRYRRIAMSCTELDLGEPAPVERAIPELAQLAVLDGKAGLGLGQPDSNEGAESMYRQSEKRSVPNGIRIGGRVAVC
jgi:hypothetical protein